MALQEICIKRIEFLVEIQAVQNKTLVYVINHRSLEKHLHNA